MEYKKPDIQDGTKKKYVSIGGLIIIAILALLFVLNPEDFKNLLLFIWIFGGN